MDSGAALMVAVGGLAMVALVLVGAAKPDGHRAGAARDRKAPKSPTTSPDRVGVSPRRAGAGGDEDEGTALPQSTLMIPPLTRRASRRSRPTTTYVGAADMSLRMHMNAGLLVGLLSGYCFAGDVDQVVTAIRESTQDTTKLTACLLLSQSASTSKADARTKKKAVELVTQRLKNQDVAMLRARGDVARKGLYGYERNEELAYRLYSKATRSVEAGWNGALMLYRRSPNGVSASDARLILDLLQKSGAATQNSRGLVGSYSHYVAGLLNEAGTAGKPDLKKAFIHYRTSARNAYVPGAYHYMRLLVQSIPKLPTTEKGVVMQEIRMMVNRWKWQSPEIMFLAGDIYAARWLPDEDGFMAQYHWRMAARMGAAREIADFEGALKTRVRRLSPEMERRLEEAIEAGFKNTMAVKNELEFVDLCAE